MAEAAGASTEGQQQAELVCPECGRTFTRAAALGAHRRRAHGVAGSSRAATTKSRAGRKRSSRRTGTHAPATTAAATAAGSESASGRRRPRRQDAADGGIRNALLQAAFPNGLPARDDVIRDVAAWLDEGERLANLR